MRDLTVPETVKPSLSQLMERAVATARSSHELVEQLDELVEASFGGPEAERVNERIESVSRKEHDTDRASYEYAKVVFAAERDMTAGELWMMLKIGQTLGDLANASERIGKRLQLMLHI
jgi:predicted phosphate transport protein (TIGR00153 family)